MARWLFIVLTTSLTAGSGCCCLGPGACDPCGSFFCLPKPIVWCGDCSECGPDGESCATCDADCGLLPKLRRGLTCGKGCGEVYWGEWVSDPPDCCDPCDQCSGCWTGHSGGPCNLGPAQRVLAALHGYKYCDKPCCGESCGPVCTKGACGGCATCGGGDIGCATCGGEVATAVHGADIYYDGSHGHEHGHSILNENWDIPRAKPVPGKPVHKAQQPSPHQFGRSAPPQGRQTAAVRQASYQR